MLCCQDMALDLDNLNFLFRVVSGVCNVHPTICNRQHLHLKQLQSLGKCLRQRMSGGQDICHNMENAAAC